MLVSFREPIGAVTTTEMKPLGRKTNSLIRTARAAALREKTTRKKRLTDRARTFRKSGLDVQKNMRRPAAGAFFYLTSPFIGHCYFPVAFLTQAPVPFLHVADFKDIVGDGICGKHKSLIACHISWYISNRRYYAAYRKAI